MIERTFKKIEKTIKRWYLMLIVGMVFVILGVLVKTFSDSLAFY